MEQTYAVNQTSDESDNDAHEEIRRALSYVGAKNEVEETLYDYGIMHLEDILVLRMGDLMAANLTLTQGHQLC